MKGSNDKYGMRLAFCGFDEAGCANEKGKKEEVFFHGNVMIGSALFLGRFFLFLTP